jgi:hypothetical protein
MYYKSYRKFLIRALCGHMTSKFYSRAHGGICKACFEASLELDRERREAERLMLYGDGIYDGQENS